MENTTISTAKINKFTAYLDKLKNTKIESVSKLYTDLENNDFTDDEINAMINIISLCKLY